MNPRVPRRTPAMNTVQKYLVEVKLPATLGRIKKVRVNAAGTADALMKASEALDREGITDWSLVKCAPELN